MADDLKARASLVRSLVQTGQAGPARQELSELLARQRKIEELRRSHPSALRTSYQARRTGIDAQEIGELKEMVADLTRKPASAP